MGFFEHNIYTLGGILNMDKKKYGENKEIAILSNSSNITDLKAEDVPVIISEQFDMISKLDSKVQNAIQKAEEAKESAEYAGSLDTGMSWGGRK